MPQKLLIADDEQKSVVPLTAILEVEGYAVDTAADGQKALDMLTAAGRGPHGAARGAPPPARAGAAPSTRRRTGRRRSTCSPPPAATSTRSRSSTRTCPRS